MPPLLVIGFDSIGYIFFISHDLSSIIPKFCKIEGILATLCDPIKFDILQGA